LLAVLDVGAHGDRHVAVAAPQHRLLELVADARDLRKRHHGPFARVQVDVLQRVDIETLGRTTLRQCRQIFVLAQLRRRCAVRPICVTKATSWRQAETRRPGRGPLACEPGRSVELDVAHLRTQKRPSLRSRSRTICVSDRRRGTGPEVTGGPSSRRVTRTASELSLTPPSGGSVRSRASMSRHDDKDGVAEIGSSD
jgi:hypothetical protein